MFNTSPTNTLSLNLSHKTDIQSNEIQKQKFLQFKLGQRKQSDNLNFQGDISLLDAALVTEVITISSEDILPVPQMFYCVLGIYSWRSEMLWIVDLENLLGYPPPLIPEANQPELFVMVIQFQGQSIGLVVSGIDNLVEHSIEKFKPSSLELFSEDLMPFLQGYFTTAENKIVMLIDAEEIFNFFSIKTEFNYSR